MATAGTLFHLLGALRRAIGRVFLWFFLVLIVSGVAVEVIAYFASGHPTLSHYSPSMWTNIAAIGLGLAFAYAAALTVIVGEVVRFLVSSIQTAGREIRSDIAAPEKLVGAVVQGIETLEKKI
jgi:hypothetical protein